MEVDVFASWYPAQHSYSTMVSKTNIQLAAVCYILRRKWGHNEGYLQ